MAYNIAQHGKNEKLGASLAMKVTAWQSQVPPEALPFECFVAFISTCRTASCWLSLKILKQVFVTKHCNCKVPFRSLPIAEPFLG